MPEPKYPDAFVSACRTAVQLSAAQAYPDAFESAYRTAYRAAMQLSAAQTPSLSTAAPNGLRPQVGPSGGGSINWAPGEYDVETDAEAPVLSERTPLVVVAPPAQTVQTLATQSVPLDMAASNGLQRQPGPAAGSHIKQSPGEIDVESGAGAAVVSERTPLVAVASLTQTRSGTADSKFSTVCHVCGAPPKGTEKFCVHCGSKRC